MVCLHRFIPVVIGCLLLAIGVFAGSCKLVDSKDQLTLLNASHWKSGEVKGRTCLILDKTGEQRPPVRRPGEYALLQRELPVGVFTIEAVTLEPAETVHRDICLIFGYQDDTHFYYAHISSSSDNKFHNIIMRVDGDSRTRINLEIDPEPRLTDDWISIRVQHATNGDIKVYAGDLKTPLMTAKDTTYPIGKIGFGAFDDRAAFSTLTME